MTLQNCFHPNHFKNPYTGEDVASSCGKCEACTNLRASSWVMRLDLEAKCHKYVLFTTLTYDEQNVPQIIRLRYEDYPEKGFGYISENGVIIETKEIKAQFEEKDFEYCKNSKVLNVLDKRDFQLFIKRLRYYFTQCDKEATLRYFICGEIGSTTYRPHGHLLLFFDSERCAREIETLLSKSWSFGNIYDPHFVQGSASKYCASYINSVTKLPKIYLHREIRPFSLFSKNPAIGTLFAPLREVQEIFDRGDITFRRYDESSNLFKDEPFWRSFESRLYPRCQRFGSLFHADRVALYRLYEEFDKYDLSAGEIAKRIKSEYIDGKFGNPFFRRYFKEIAFKKIPCVRMQKQPDVGEWSNMPFLPSDLFVEQPFVTLKTYTKVYNEQSLIRFIAAISRVYHQAKVFGVSIDYYVSKIENYYENVVKDKWRKSFEFQNEYFKHYPKWHWIYFDFCFYDKVTSTPYFGLSDETRCTLRFLFDDDVPLIEKEGYNYLNIPSFETLPSFRSHFIIHKKIASDLVKQKENNDYALANKDKFGNILKYQNS